MPRVSRRHAVIQAQVSDEYWLGDSGSRNGTYVNAKRIAKPTRLQHADVIRRCACLRDSTCHNSF